MSQALHSQLQADYEVLIIGAGAAGLAAAMTFGRLRRKVLVCDDGQPRNLPAQHMNNFPGYDGVPPQSWRNQVRAELQKYPSIQLHAERVQSVSPDKNAFSVSFASGSQLKVQKVLLAYGVRDQLPDIPNLQALWGDSVVHCPYCHGFEFQEQALGVLGDGEMALHILALLLGLSDDLILFTDGPSQLTPAQRQKISSRQIPIIETPLQELEQENSKLAAVLLQNGQRIPRQALYLVSRFPFGRSTRIGEELGCKLTEFGWFEVDPTGKTSIEGVYAAGDLAGSHGQSVLNSAASGSIAAARIVSELLTERAGF